MLIRGLIVPVVFSLLTVSTPIRAQVDYPRQIPYQGHLELNGEAQSGDFNFKFELFDQDTGGTLLWSEDINQVQVAAGKFSVVFGSDPGNPLRDVVWDNEKLYLQITVNNILLTGRQRLLSVPYSMRNDTSGDYRIHGKLTVVGTGAVGDGATINNGAIINNGIDVSEGAVISGGAVIHDGATINGDVSMPGNVVLRGKHDTAAWNGGANTHTTTTWNIQARKWQISIANDYAGRAYPIPHAAFLEYCADEDGCTVMLGMSGWTGAASQNVQATQRRQMFYDEVSGFYRLDDAHGNALEATDGDSGETNLFNGWNACILTDYYCCAAQNDDGKQLYLHWSTSTYNNSYKVCHLTITD